MKNKPVPSSRPAASAERKRPSEGRSSSEKPSSIVRERIVSEDVEGETDSASALAAPVLAVSKSVTSIGSALAASASAFVAPRSDRSVACSLEEVVILYESKKPRL
jgi:hypothetical protein